MAGHRFTVKIERWELYRVPGVMADTEEGAAEKALEIYDTTTNYEHVDGGVNHVEAEADDE